MKGFKDSSGKFHPIKNYNKVRKRRSPTTLQGIKIIKKVNPKSQDTKDMIKGVTESLSEQPKSVRNKSKTIIFKDKTDSEDFVAKVDTDSGVVTMNHKSELTEGDYKALADHEFEHIDFNNKLESGNKKYEQFIKDGNMIAPFTPDLMMTLAEQEQAFVEGNFGILPDKRLEYPDEINSVILEIETRQKLGLETNILNEEEFEKAKILVNNLHKK